MDSTVIPSSQPRPAIGTHEPVIPAAKMPAPRATSVHHLAEQHLAELRSFRKASNEFLARESWREYLMMAGFIVISSIAGAAILSAVLWATRMVRGW